MGVEGLHGCVVVVVVTFEVIYMNHIWEGSFAKEKFKADVLDFIAQGAPGRNRPGLDPYTAPGQITNFELDPLKQLVVMVIAARDRKALWVNQPAQFDSFQKLQSALMNRFPHSIVERYNYETALYGQEKDPNSVLGKVFVQYDPAEPDCEGVLRPSIRIWVQGEDVLTDAFKNYPAQGQAAPGKRATFNSLCPLSWGEPVTPYDITATYEYTGPYDGPATLLTTSTRQTSSTTPTILHFVKAQRFLLPASTPDLVN
jgi:hypothetical protein